mmetsp:Transcript_13253/g.17687  ORF Transcript_13253/g.17687 Transcript_13253/m.17687 type:complete len:87 (+) Transcript_13253:128-388(+)|eukprot:CAMPEP_0197297284 /NCGR_PEP_ID=MMETSP0890-20130614/40634_1 /TAXON_ID=44058 ORGANISM="Aureoumbra lagunensis, Strain CCMP1510" /NCGR_SAMPLE_ID=MMETSP0890 /ASSEMBLY_ACC=CAM_ASM_000533 /LENGTH=86 /DNA_ID=CAMNT_0042774347 /DNA_START=42 /DNA_END=302 /DNA_ORIENTATION=-
MDLYDWYITTIVKRTYKCDLFACDLSTDSTRYITALWDHTVCLWDAENAEILYGCASSSHGSRIITTAYDGKVLKGVLKVVIVNGF